MHVAEDVADLPYATDLTKFSGSLASAEDYSAAYFDGLEIKDANAAHSRFIECAFSHTLITGGHYRRARFHDVWMKSMRIVSAEMAETDWLDVAILGGSIAALEAYSSSFRRVTLRRCKVDSANFREATLTDVTFADCILNDVDWSGAALTNVRFPGSTLNGVQFARARFTAVDLRGAKRLDLSADADSLKGGIIDTGQLIEIAPLLAAVLGISVRD